MTEVDLLSAAQSKLGIQYVRLQNCKVQCEPDFFPESRPADNWELQEFSEVRRVHGHDVTVNGEADTGAILYKILYSLAIRVLKPRVDLSADNITESDIWVEVSAEFEACYSADSQIPDEELTVFVEKNVPFHIWPYWREFVQNSCGRIGMFPPIPVQSIYHANNSNNIRTPEEDDINKK